MEHFQIVFQNKNPANVVITICVQKWWELIDANHAEVKQDAQFSIF